MSRATAYGPVSCNRYIYILLLYLPLLPLLSPFIIPYVHRLNSFFLFLVDWHYGIPDTGLADADLVETLFRSTAPFSLSNIIMYAYNYIPRRVPCSQNRF